MSTNGSTFTVSNPWRDRILKGEVCSVMSCKFFVSNEVAMMVKMAGIDGMFIDMEHSVLTIRDVSQLVLACNYVGVSPIVRIPSKSHWHLSRILDAGAAAVVIPHCETVQEVKDVVRNAKYGPLGIRGCANNQPILNFQTVPTLVANDLLNRETMVIPMIETPAAVELADEFFAIDGVDGILIGSNDLCTDLGIPGKYDDPRYLDSVEKIIAAGVKAGKPIGIGGIGGRLDLLERFFQLGATWSLSGGDGSILQAGMNKIGQNYVEINGRGQHRDHIMKYTSSLMPDVKVPFPSSQVIDLVHMLRRACGESPLSSEQQKDGTYREVSQELSESYPGPQTFGSIVENAPGMRKPVMTPALFDWHAKHEKDGKLFHALGFLLVPDGHVFNQWVDTVQSLFPGIRLVLVKTAPHVSRSSRIGGNRRWKKVAPKEFKKGNLSSAFEFLDDWRKARSSSRLFICSYSTWQSNLIETFPLKRGELKKRPHDEDVCTHQNKQARKNEKVRYDVPKWKGRFAMSIFDEGHIMRNTDT
ncbi:hypothetical protein D0864_13422 [Hortaea werneckii]|uniref:HpcH/HpaI aldolase/citrate lyase domain-containing protein n=1 Tax=Hortaea werneckii TaxID=91943 RepID=A0A3M7D174_HORWE|nr:hypothetical protein D0864_13422 [Hortaea werneckii]RMY94372.1 hypothetical protein D0862_08973 [Hortaea werneckii]